MLKFVARTNVLKKNVLIYCKISPRERNHRLTTAVLSCQEYATKRNQSRGNTIRVDIMHAD